MLAGSGPVQPDAELVPFIEQVIDPFLGSPGSESAGHHVLQLDRHGEEVVTVTIVDLIDTCKHLL